MIPGDTDNTMLLQADITEHVSALKNGHPIWEKKSEGNKKLK